MSSVIWQRESVEFVSQASIAGRQSSSQFSVRVIIQVRCGVNINAIKPFSLLHSIWKVVPRVFAIDRIW